MKKTYSPFLPSKGGKILQLVRFMKLTILLLLVTFMQVSAHGYSQEKLSLDYHNISVEHALKILGKQSSYTFLYKNSMIPDGKVSIQVKDMDVPHIMDQLLAGTGLSFNILSNKLIVITSKEGAVQDTTIRGTVTDQTGAPLIGASVRVSGTPTGTVTNASGAFQLSVPANPNLNLNINYIGYRSKTVRLSDIQDGRIQLEPTTAGLNAVVVVGYGSQKKIDLTGSVSAVSAKNMNWKPVGQVSEALQGMAPGVTITQGSGQPGLDQGSIRIRGIGTLNNNDPLVLIDGVQSNINDIDPNDIASISVLKDAAAASIYGVRAANGVILITTKRGSNGKMRIHYSDYFGWQQPTRLAQFVNAPTYMKLVNQMYENMGSGDIFTSSDISAYTDPNRDLNKYPDNYWLKKILTGSGFQQEHSVALSGGSDKMDYRFSTNYFDQKGLIQNMDFNRLTVRLNTNVKVSKKLSFQADMAARLADRKEPQDNGAGSAWFQFGQGAIMNPTIVDTYTDGTWGIGRGDGNPIRLQQEGGLHDYKDNLLTGNFRADYNLIQGLKLSAIASVNYDLGFNSLHNVAMDYYNFFTNPHTLIATKGQNEITKQFNSNWFQNYQGLADYTHHFGYHSINLLAGVSQLSQRNDYLMGYRKNLPNGTLEQINAGASAGQVTNGDASQYALRSFFGRLNYAYKDKYLFEANIRRDGSSRFATGQKWGTFPSFSAGWRLSSESFMKSLTFIQDLKLRGSWGELGNDAIGNYPYQSIYQLGNSYPFGGVLVPGAGLSTYPNSSLSWETTKMSDAGLDLTILNGRLDLSYDYYVKNTSGILLQLPIPQTVGLGAPYQNAGAVQNKGWEFNAEYRGQIAGALKYDIRANLSDVRNKITDLKHADWISTDYNGITTAYTVGQPIGAYYGYITQGIFQSADQVTKHAQQPGTTAPGDLMYADVNGDGVVNAKDRVYLGSNIPRYTYGLNLGLTYKAFDLSAFFQGVGKVSINTMVMREAPTSPDGNFKSFQANSWTASNTQANYPRLATSKENYVSSSFWIQSGAYLRLKSLQFGYTLPEGLVGHAGLNHLRVFVSGQNLLTWSKLEKDIDPEAPSDDRYYPQVRTLTFGLNVDL